MSNLPIETSEPDPAATSISNDQTVNKEDGDPSAPTNTEVIQAAAEGKETNGKSEVEENSKDGENSATKCPDSDLKTPRTYEDGVLKTSAREDPYAKSNSKYDPSILPQTDDPKKIRAQVEFYFGDANLPTDKYMWGMTDGSTNLPISIEKICTFGRMKRFRPVSAVVAALRESNFLEVTGPEGQEEVKRKVPYDPTFPRSKAESRSIYVKGFGDEEPSSQFDIEAFFAPYGPTNAVRLRRTPEKLFKGSVFVEFTDEETAEKFLALDPKPLWKGKHVLKIQSKKEYTDQKAQDIKDGKAEPNETWGSSRGRFRGRGWGGNRGGRSDRGDRDRGRDRGDRDPDDWKRRREEDRANGFKDRRGDRRGKGGRGRRDDRGPRNNDRNREREQKNGDKPESEEKVEAKCARDPDGDEEEPSAKKVDNKPEVNVENDKKRAREDDDGAEEASTKRVDMKSEVAAEAS